jgi:hypothetical protein
MISSDMVITTKWVEARSYLPRWCSITHRLILPFTKAVRSDSTVIMLGDRISISTNAVFWIHCAEFVKARLMSKV